MFDGRFYCVNDVLLSWRVGRCAHKDLPESCTKRVKGGTYEQRAAINERAIRSLTA